MGLGLGRTVRETNGPPLIFLLQDSSLGQTEVVFRDVFGKAIMVVQSDGDVLLRKNIKTEQLDYFGVLDE